MPLTQLVVLFHAQAIMVSRFGEEPGCENIHTGIDHTGYEWQATGEWTECSATCGGGFQTSPATCRDSQGREASWHLCEGNKPTVQRECGTDVCSCVLTRQDAYWYVPEETIIDVGGFVEFACDIIPNYMISEKARFECTELGELNQTHGCSCARKGGLIKNYQLNQANFGDWESQSVLAAAGFWYELAPDSGRPMVDYPDTLVWDATVLTGIGAGISFTFRSSTSTDSIIFGVTPLECMKICLSHNQWAQDQGGAKGCTMAVPRTPTDMNNDAQCWLRRALPSGLEGASSNLFNRHGYSYDLKCLVDELKAEFGGIPEEDRTQNTVLELLDTSPEYIPAV